MRGCVREACDYCYGFAAEFADISVGSIGSEFGWSTVITRTDAAKDLVKRAKKAGVIEMKKLSKEQVKAVRKLALYKKQGNLKNIYEKAEPIRIEYAGGSENAGGVLRRGVIAHGLVSSKRKGGEIKKGVT